MSKPLVFVKTKVLLNDKELDSWDLVSFGDCPIMHAAWNPEKQFLVCQFNSIKENQVDIPKQSNSGKVTFAKSKAHQYYRVTLYDKDAVQHILETYVSNYNENFDWTLQEQFEDLEVAPKQEVSE